MKTKICGVIDKDTLKYINSHPNSPQFVGFICNYEKSKRFVQFDDLKNLVKVDKKNTKYVAVLVKPTQNELINISKLNFDYFQVYDMGVKEVKAIKENFKVGIIVSITIKEKKDVMLYKKYINIADIILFDSKGYEKSLSFDHDFIKDIKCDIEIMLAGNIKIDDDLEKFNKITDIIDISGGVETSGLKDISKINTFLNKVEQINNET